MQSATDVSVSTRRCYTCLCALKSNPSTSGAPKEEAETEREL
jgi:hypothetical protein